MKKIIIVVFLIFALIPIYDSYAEHNSDKEGHNPNRGYNKESCEKWEVTDEQGRVWKGHWLGHMVGCLMNGRIYGEYTVEKAESI